MTGRWRTYFRPVILERGWEYYEEDLVDDLKHTHDGWQAVVHGTYDYDVTVERSASGDLEWAECSCPYGEGGNLCKHMAAVLFAVEEERDCRRSTSDSFRRSLEDLTDRCSMDGSYIPCNRAERYIECFTSHLEEAVGECLKHNDVSGAFEVCRTAFSAMEEADLSEAEEMQYELDDALEACLMQVLEKASESQIHSIRTWICAQYDRRDQICHTSVIEQVYEYGFHDPEHLSRLYREIQPLFTDPSREHEVSVYDLQRYRDILVRMGSGTEEYEAWLSSHEDLECVRRMRMYEAEEQEDWDAVYTLMKYQYDRCTAQSQKESYVYRLYELSRKRNDPEDTKHWLSLYVQQKADPSEADVLTLRSLCTPAEWADIRTGLLERCVYLRTEICFLDGMYPELLENLRQCRISVTDRYAETLKEICPAELAQLYADHLRRLQDRYPNKALYEEMRKYLKILAGIPGGRKKAEEFMMDWLVRYPKRRAMQEMIREVNIQIHGNVVYMANI